ncbi:unnamed protein product [Gemmata massiliana]|uniref:Uncharacterized protein n=1 Tax=Gemmata massiliana TaxID=1210884 RepID=A0A6P2CRH3_9BACT|nr:hypothetical protein [Gemmata massiliana]VTR91678.1 unnamed protein product [Gemmata massiliana]
MRKWLLAAVAGVALLAVGCKTEAQRQQERATGMIILVLMGLGGAGYVMYRLSLPKDVLMQERALRAAREQRAHERSQKNKELLSTFGGPLASVAGAVVKRGLGS